jgi:peptidoglycan/xylan/chitin deacetylase (PgdA/CDA1 family)
VTGQGTFLLTFDVELAWGLFFDAAWRERALREYGAVREVFPAILALLERWDVRATFAFVGHLFLDRCERVDGRVHPEMPRPDHDCFPGDWYAFDPGTDLTRDPLWYGRDLVTAVREAEPAHEIGAHGFSHAFLDGGRDLARSEMAAAAAAAREVGVEPRSFVYPRNLVGHVEELSPAGYTCYRAAGNARRKPVRGFLRRLVGAAPPVGHPRRVAGVTEVPTSIPMLPAYGVRRLVPLRSRVAEVRKGLRRARDGGAVFHLWTHPHNFVEGRGQMLAYLEAAMSEVAAFRERGEVVVRSMGEVE